jgi:hypothetical protein
MLALAEILGLIILNVALHAAFTRWKSTRRTSRIAVRRNARPALHYPLHPSPSFTAIRCDAVPEHAAHVRPAGIDW